MTKVLRYLFILIRVATSIEQIERNELPEVEPVEFTRRGRRFEIAVREIR